MPRPDSPPEGDVGARQAVDILLFVAATQQDAVQAAFCADRFDGADDTRIGVRQEADARDEQPRGLAWTQREIWAVLGHAPLQRVVAGGEGLAAKRQLR